MSAAPRLLLIAQPNSYRIAPFLRSAEQIGVDVLIASQGEFSLISEVHKGLHLNFEHPERAIATIVQEHQHNPFSAVLGSDDSTVELAALSAQALGLIYNPPSAARVSRRKDLARDHLQAAGIPIPDHQLISLSQPLSTQNIKVSYPCVIKPINLSASRGVIRVNSTDELQIACNRVSAILKDGPNNKFEKTHALLEHYIDGSEFAFEGFLDKGSLTTVAIFDKPDPLTGPYFEETIYVTPSRQSVTMQQAIRDRIEQACVAYGLTTGPIHAEIRINDEDIWILEIAARTIGGNCARVLDGDRRYALEELSIKLALGQHVKLEQNQGARGVMMMPNPGRGILRRVEGINAARAVEHVTRVDVLAQTGHELIPLPEGNQYPGYIFAYAESPEQVIMALKTSCAKLNFVLAPLWTQPINATQI